MTKPDLMAELAEVVRLCQRATPSPWRVEPAWSERGGSDVSIANREHMGDDWDVCTVHSTEANALLIPAAINFLRTHHAELEAVVRDVARYAPCLWVPDDDTDSWDTACGNKHQFTAGDPADNLYQHCPYCGGKLVEPNTDTTAMHNSAREG